MTKQRKAAVLAFTVGVAFILIELGFNLQTGLAGLFVTGMAGGLLIGDAMTRRAKESTQ